MVTNDKCQQKVKLQSPKLSGPPDHIVFVIHGIGQQTEEFGFFQTHLQSLYDTTNKAVEENQVEKKLNIQYVPIEWHKHIHKETDKVMKDISLTSIPFMRMINNEYLSDAFFYLSKDRGQSIVDHVTKTFNEAYLEFVVGNSGFKGKVAILAYSLGGIITWDILSNQIEKNHVASKLDINFPRLDFKPDYLFTLGSPLSAFLTVRNQDLKVYHPHASIVFENIYHPFDPLAYRLEPMLKSSYQSAEIIEKSERINSIWNKGYEIISRQHERFVKFISREEKGGNMILSAVKGYFLPHYGTIRSIDIESNISQESNKKRRRDSCFEESKTNKKRKRRIDFVLQPEKMFGYLPKNEYLSGLTAHFSYWTHKDLMWHIVRRLENNNI